MKQLNNQGSYDILYPKTIGSQVSGITGEQVSGIFTAEQTLTDSTSQLYGQSGSVVPNDIFAILSKAAIISGNDLTSVTGQKLSNLNFEVGRYVGTGTVGEAHPNSITFSNEILFFAIVGYSQPYQSEIYFYPTFSSRNSLSKNATEYTSAWAISTNSFHTRDTWIPGLGLFQGTSTSVRPNEFLGKLSSNGKTYSWYFGRDGYGSSFPEYQFNALNETYYYFAVTK